MHKAFAAALAALLLVGSASAQIQQQQRLPPGTQRPNVRVIGCTGGVDLAINSVTLRKLATPGHVQMNFEVLNLGPGEWVSGVNQQRLSVVVRDFSGSRTVSETWIAAGRFAPGSAAQRVAAPIQFNAFDTSELEIAISWEPDIRTDGNTCNDDRSATNDELRVTSDQLREFFWQDQPRTFGR